MAESRHKRLCVIPKCILFLLPEGNWIGYTWRQWGVGEGSLFRLCLCILEIINNREGDDMTEVVFGTSGERLEATNHFFTGHE